MLYKETTAVSSELHIKHIKFVWAKFRLLRSQSNELYIANTELQRARNKRQGRHWYKQQLR
jgi:hypothetical protein